MTLSNKGKIIQFHRLYGQTLVVIFGLYITHEYGNRWVKYATFLRRLGYAVDLEVLKNKRTPNQITAKRYSSKYDIVWSFAADYIWYKVLSDDFIDAVRNGGSVFVG